jgi:hypothetical protein
MKDALGHGSNAGHATGVQQTPKLQRRHFEEIAAQLKNAPDAGSPAHTQRVNDMADKLATTNPGFRRDFFVAATGGNISSTGKAYRNKGAGANEGAVKRKAAKFTSSEADDYNRDLTLRLRNNQVGSGMKFR